MTTSHQRGLTLIELMVSTIILAIITSAAVPAMKSLFERKSVNATGDFFVKSIKLARMEAVQRGKTVQVVTTSGNEDWSQGWTIEFTNDAGVNETIRSFPAPNGSPVFTSDVYGDATTLTILPTGQVTTVGSFDMYYADCVGNQRLSFNILLSGLIQRGLSACSTLDD